jgi:hypothetical protein
VAPTAPPMPTMAPMPPTMPTVAPMPPTMPTMPTTPTQEICRTAGIKQQFFRYRLYSTKSLENTKKENSAVIVTAYIWHALILYVCIMPGFNTVGASFSKFQYSSSMLLPNMWCDSYYE